MGCGGGLFGAVKTNHGNGGSAPCDWERSVAVHRAPSVQFAFLVIITVILTPRPPPIPSDGFERSLRLDPLRRVSGQRATD